MQTFHLIRQKLAAVKTPVITYPNLKHVNRRRFRIHESETPMRARPHAVELAIPSLRSPADWNLSVKRRNNIRKDIYMNGEDTAS